MRVIGCSSFSLRTLRGTFWVYWVHLIYLYFQTHPNVRSVRYTPKIDDHRISIMFVDGKFRFSEGVKSSLDAGGPLPQALVGTILFSQTGGEVNRWIMME